MLWQFRGRHFMLQNDINAPLQFHVYRLWQMVYGEEVGAVAHSSGVIFSVVIWDDGLKAHIHCCIVSYLHKSNNMYSVCVISIVWALQLNLYHISFNGNYLTIYYTIHICMYTEKWLIEYDKYYHFILNVLFTHSHCSPLNHGL